MRVSEHAAVDQNTPLATQVSDLVRERHQTVDRGAAAVLDRRQHVRFAIGQIVLVHV